MSESQIRFLVEQFYDLQKLRVGAFNLTVAYVKSHFIYETQKEIASHKGGETHGVSASREGNENQYKHASQKTCETHVERARPSVIAHRIVKGHIKTPEEIAELVWYHNRLHETEKELAKRLDTWSSRHPLRINFLDKIYGIGPILSSAILAWLSPVERFPNISKLWAHCGLAPGQKRRRGRKINYNPHLKTLMWKIASSFEKQRSEKSYYRRIYDWKKRYYLNREDLRKPIEEGVKGARLHVRLMAMRYTVKRFLADLWLYWRRLEGLPVTEPYAHGVLGHVDFEEWKPDR